MTKNDVIRMAREVGFEVHDRKQQARVGVDALLGIDSTAKLERFAALVAAAERETCAKNYPAWQPISTAPKNGDEILLCCGNGDMGVAYWRDDDHMTGWTCGLGTKFNNPDRWMPLLPINSQSPKDRSMS